LQVLGLRIPGDHRSRSFTAEGVAHVARSPHVASLTSLTNVASVARAAPRFRREDTTVAETPDKAEHMIAEAGAMCQRLTLPRQGSHPKAAYAFVPGGTTRPVTSLPRHDAGKLPA
jgi:hypothetical protein